MAPLLEVRDLTVEFAQRGGGLGRARPMLKAVDSVSFALEPGKTLGVVGESGSGKSTVLRAILRLVPIAAGEIWFEGTNITTLDERALRVSRRAMRVVFQDPLASLDPRMNLGEIVAEPIRSLAPGLNRAETRARVEQALGLVGLDVATDPGLLNRYPHEFSGGQCQRIAIARAMAVEPKLILCDEPVSSLDVSIQAQIVNLLAELQRTRGVALVFVSHNLAVVRHISHRILVMHQGRVVEYADRDALYAAPQHPYTKALLDAVPVPDPTIERARLRARAGLRTG
jgi:oligopeptide transport system ATP-binding protein